MKDNIKKVVTATKLFNNHREKIADEELHLVVIATKMFKVISFKDFSLFHGISTNSPI